MKFLLFLGLATCCYFSLASNVDQCDTEEGFCTLNDEAAPKGANVDGSPLKVDTKLCVDRHPDNCKIYFKNGECDRNPGWMTVNCPASCGNCHLLDPKVRCNRKTLGIDDEPIYLPGDLNRMFESIVSKFGEKYEVKVESKKPWVVTFDNFLSGSEVDAILLTTNSSWERSTDTGKSNEYGEVGRILSKTRTSSNSWCREKCTNHPLVQNVMSKIEEVTGVPRYNYESFQVLKYDIGQAYAAHHDYGGGAQGQLICGPRILTFFLYLSDVEEGGETAFPSLGIKVKPKKGKAVLWPSVMDHDLLQYEPLSLHEARPVIKGTKYAANSWIHLYDYDHANLWGCTGTFDVL